MNTVGFTLCNSWRRMFAHEKRDIDCRYKKSRLVSEPSPQISLIPKYVNSSSSYRLVSIQVIQCFYGYIYQSVFGS